MGNSASAASERQLPVPATRGDATLGNASGQGRDQQAASMEGQKMAVARYIAPQSAPQSRIVVDIRSANLDKDYNVYIQQKPHRDVDVASVWSGLQALGGLFITVLTIQKLWEDIRFIRLLRRELSSLVGSLTDAAGGPDSSNSDGPGGARPTRPRAGFGPVTGTSSAFPRQLDTHLDELSDLLGATRGAAAAADEAAAEAAQQRQSTAESSAEVSTRRETTWASISGLVDVKILLQEVTVLPTLRPDLFQGIRAPPKALLLFGPPGTGKTLLARAVATESRATFLPVTGSSVLSMWYGQSEQNVKALFEKARKRQPAIIFIDEVDSLLGKRSSGGRQDSTPDKRVTNEFLAFIDGIQTQQAGGGGGGGDAGGDTRVVVIAATNTPWDLDEAALSRFSRRIYVPLPDKVTREALMRKAMQGVACDVSDADWRRLAEQCDKYSGRDLVQVCREAAMRPLRELWGKRLLEGSQASSTDEAGPAPLQTAAAHQRLAELVAKSLAACAPKRGSPPAAAAAAEAADSGGVADGTAASPSGTAAAGPSSRGARARAGPGWPPRWRWRLGPLGGDRYSQTKKQARRELERWKRRHGASWCDVDAVMQQAERLLEARSPPGAADTAGGAPAAGEAPQQQQQQQQQQQAAADAPTSAAGGGVRIRIRVQPGADAAAAPTHPPVRLHLELLREDSGAAHTDPAAPSPASPAAAAEAAPPPPAQAVVAEGAGPGAGPLPGTASSGHASASAPTDDSPPERRTAAAGPAPKRSSSSSSGRAAAPTGPPPVPPAAAGAGAGAGAARSGDDGAAAMSLDKLLTLPADRVRPVTAADLEAALQIISCTEMDQSAKYSEWDEQYGSGALEAGRRGGGRGKVWMTMYV